MFLYYSLLDIVYTRIENGSTIFKDEYRACNLPEEHGFIHKSITHSQKKEYVNGTVHVNNYERRSNHIRYE